MTEATWAIAGSPIRGRACGSCSFCCTVVPVQEVGFLVKPGGVRCPHLKSRGCGIYESRPMACMAWSCTWLFQPEAASLRRPDLCDYAVDPMPQQVLIDGRPVMTVQVWVDRKRPEAHRAPELRAYLALMAEQTGMPAIVRWPNGSDGEGSNAMMLFAPCLTGEEGWIERVHAMIGPREMQEKLAAARREQEEAA